MDTFTHKTTTKPMEATRQSTTVRSLLQSAVGIKDNKLLTDLSIKCYGSLVVLEECLVDKEESLLKLVHVIHERYEEEHKVHVSSKFWCRTFIMRLLYLSDWYVLKNREEGSVDWSKFSREKFIAFYRARQQLNAQTRSTTTSTANPTGDGVTEEGESVMPVGGEVMCTETFSSSTTAPPSNQEIADMVMNGEIHFVSDSFSTDDQEEDQRTQAPSLTDTSASMSSPNSKSEHYVDAGDDSLSRLAEVSKFFCKLADDEGDTTTNQANVSNERGKSDIHTETIRKKKREEEITVCFEEPKGLWEDAWADTYETADSFFAMCDPLEVAMSSQMPVDERPAKIITA